MVGSCSAMARPRVRILRGIRSADICAVSDDGAGEFVVRAVALLVGLFFDLRVYIIKQV